jgi:hypothetical protein
VKRRWSGLEGILRAKKKKGGLDWKRKKNNWTSTSFLKMETVCFSETVVSAYQSTRYLSPEQHRHLSRREKLRSCEFVDVA